MDHIYIYIVRDRPLRGSRKSSKRHREGNLEASRADPSLTRPEARSPE